MEYNKSNTDNSESSTFNESGEPYVLNNPLQQAYISRWVYSLTEAQLNQAFTNLELEAQDLEAHRKLLLSGFLEKTMTALNKADAAR